MYGLATLRDQRFCLWEPCANGFPGEEHTSEVSAFMGANMKSNADETFGPCAMARSSNATTTSHSTKSGRESEHLPVVSEIHSKFPIGLRLVTHEMDDVKFEPNALRQSHSSPDR